MPVSILRTISFALLGAAAPASAGMAMAAAAPGMVPYQKGAGTYTWINALSGDASLGVGYTDTALGPYASAWSNGGVISDLGLAIDNYALNISNDGSTIVGYDD